MFVCVYAGTLCEADVNECASGPCENRGDCSESSSDGSSTFSGEYILETAETSAIRVS